MNPEQEYIPDEESVIVSEIEGRWEAVTKDNDGNAHIHTLNKHSIKKRPKVDLDELLVRKVPPVRITPSRRQKPSRETELAIFLPDAQIPFHDESAVMLGHLAVRELMPDQVVLLGDMLDFPSLSRFEQRPEWSGKVQESLDRYHKMLAQIRSDAPDAEIFVLHGNHEERLQKSIVNNNAELLGIKRANAAKELGVLTLEYLLRLEDLEITSVPGYPNGEIWLRDHLKATHGNIVRSNGSTAAAYMQRDPTASLWFGHIHRSELQWRTTPTRYGAQQRYAASPGTLSRIDGTVPGFSSTIDEHGRVVEKAENWQQGIGLAEHSENLSNPHLIHIESGQMMIEGKTYSVDNDAR